MPRLTHHFSILLLATLISGCASLISSSALGLANNLGNAIVNQDDPQTVADGAPAYLLLLDSLVESDANNPRVLIAGAKLYTAYSGVFVDEPERARRMTDRARSYARQAVCLEQPSFCQALDQPYEQFYTALQQWEQGHVDLLYQFAVSWAGWLQAHKDDWNAVADLPKIKACMEKVLQLDESHDNGGAHGYMALMTTFLPPALGGKPELGRSHFERAIALSEGRNLMTKILFAEHYARLVFDQELHDQLVKEVLNAEAKAPGYTLFNVLAKQKALTLQASGKEYF